MVIRNLPEVAIFYLKDMVIEGDVKQKHTELEQLFVEDTIVNLETIVKGLTLNKAMNYDDILTAKRKINAFRKYKNITVYRDNVLNAALTVKELDNITKGVHFAINFTEYYFDARNKEHMYEYIKLLKNVYNKTNKYSENINNYIEKSNFVLCGSFLNKLSKYFGKVRYASRVIHNYYTSSKPLSIFNRMLSYPNNEFIYVVQDANSELMYQYQEINPISYGASNNILLSYFSNKSKNQDIVGYSHDLIRKDGTPILYNSFVRSLTNAQLPITPQNVIMYSNNTTRIDIENDYLLAITKVRNDDAEIYINNNKQEYIVKIYTTHKHLINNGLYEPKSHVFANGVSCWGNLTSPDSDAIQTMVHHIAEQYVSKRLISIPQYMENLIYTRRHIGFAFKYNTIKELYENINSVSNIQILNETIKNIETDIYSTLLIFSNNDPIHNINISNESFYIYTDRPVLYNNDKTFTLPNIIDVIEFQDYIANIRLGEHLTYGETRQFTIAEKYAKIKFPFTLDIAPTKFGDTFLLFNKTPKLVNKIFNLNNIDYHQKIYQICNVDPFYIFSESKRGLQLNVSDIETYTRNKDYINKYYGKIASVEEILIKTHTGQDLITYIILKNIEDYDEEYLVDFIYNMNQIYINNTNEEHHRLVEFLKNVDFKNTIIYYMLHNKIGNVYNYTTPEMNIFANGLDALSILMRILQDNKMDTKLWKMFSFSDIHNFELKNLVNKHKDRLLKHLLRINIDKFLNKYFDIDFLDFNNIMKAFIIYYNVNVINSILYHVLGIYLDNIDYTELFNEYKDNNDIINYILNNKLEEYINESKKYINNEFYNEFITEYINEIKKHLHILSKFMNNVNEKNDKLFIYFTNKIFNYIVSSVNKINRDKKDYLFYVDLIKLYNIEYIKDINKFTNTLINLRINNKLSMLLQLYGIDMFIEEKKYIEILENNKGIFNTDIYTKLNLVWKYLNEDIYKALYKVEVDMHDFFNNVINGYIQFEELINMIDLTDMNTLGIARQASTLVSHIVIDDREEHIEAYEQKFKRSLR